MVCSRLGNRTRIGLLLLCSAVIPSCGGGGGGGGSSGSTSAAGQNSNPSVCGDGRLVAFETSSKGDRQVVIVDRVNATSQVVTAGDDVANSVVTPDGRFVAFDSRPAGSSTRQVFVEDLTTNVTTLVSETPDLTPGDGDSTNPSISDDGRLVAFESKAVNLGARSASSHSILVRDVSIEAIRLASSAVPSDDVNPAISGNGSFVAFESQPVGGPGFSQVLLFSLLDVSVFQVSQTPGDPELDGPSGAPSISSDGQFVAFESRATNLQPSFPDTASFHGESNILVRDMGNGSLTLASVAVTPGDTADGDSLHPAMSPDGQLVAFDSTATNLTTDFVVPGTSNVFVRDLGARSTELITTPPTAPPPTPPTVVEPTTPRPRSTLPPTSSDAGLSTGAPVQPIAPTSGGVTAAPGQPIAPVSGVGTGAPVQPIAPTSGGVTAAPGQPTTPTSGLSTSTPVQPIAPGSSFVTGTPTQPTGVSSGLVTSTPVDPIPPGTALVTGTPVPSTGTASGLVTSTPGQPISPVASPTPIVTTVSAVAGAVRPRLSRDAAWVVFASRGRIFLARRGTGEVSEISGPVPLPVGK